MRKSSRIIPQQIPMAKKWREVSDTRRQFCGVDEPQTDADSLR